MKKFFVTGTDTGVGKTVASAILTLALQAHYWKPIQSGLADEDSEQEKIKNLTGLTDYHFLDSVYSFQASLSPDQAARLENKSIDLQECIIPHISENLIVEGAGGVFVPLNEKHCILDLIDRLKFPVIIVARGGLGTINHTLLTIAALRQRNLNIHGIIFNGDLNKENKIAIEKWGKVKTLFHIPLFESLDKTTIKDWVSNHSEGFKNIFKL